MTAEERGPPDRVTVGYSRPPDTKNMEGLPPESESNSYRSQGPEQKSTSHTERKITKMTIFFLGQIAPIKCVGGALKVKVHDGALSQTFHMFLEPSPLWTSSPSL